MAFAPAEPIGTRSAPSSAAISSTSTGGRVRLTSSFGRPPFGQAREDEGVGDLVRDMAEPRPGEQAAPPLLDQQAARFLSQMRRQIFVGQKAAPSGSVVGRVKQG